MYQAGAMINSGLLVNAEIYVKLEVPPVSTKTIKKREIKLGIKIEKNSKKSCLDATELEQNLCCLISIGANKEGAVSLKASCNMVWQRKGSARPYKRRSGHGVLIGTKSEKILSSGTRISNWRTVWGK